MHRALAAALVALLAALALPVTPVAAATQAKVVVVVGPVGDHNAHYKDDANDIVTEAKRYTSNVTKIFTPNATWAKVKAAAQGANVFVYLGHGNGWPSIYAPFQMQTKDGLGLDPSTGADGIKTVYYGEQYIRDNIRLAPSSVVLLYHLCYASGNTEPGLSQGTFAQAKERVDNYGAGFIGAGARAVFAEGHPSHPAISYMRQLFTTDRSMATIFRTVPTWHDNLYGPYPSQRTPGVQYQLDTDTTHAVGLLPLAHRRPVAHRLQGDPDGLPEHRRAPRGLRAARRAPRSPRPRARRCSRRPRLPPTRSRRRRRTLPAHDPPADRRRGRAGARRDADPPRRRCSAAPRAGSSARPGSRRATAPRPCSGRSTRVRPGCRPTTTACTTRSS